jgi:competence protein CoiA
MPFVATLARTQQRVDITRLADPHAVLDGEEVVCQMCEAPMSVHAGQVKRAHFAHKAGTRGEYCLANPESPEHLAGKEFIARALRRELAIHRDARIEYEVRVPEVGRIADVMVTFPGGWRIACECQLAAIMTGTLEERTADYLRAGIDTIWFLGKGAATERNIRWCLEPGWGRQMFALELCFDDGLCSARHRYWDYLPNGMIAERCPPYPLLQGRRSWPLIHFVRSRDVKRSFEIWEQLSADAVRRTLGVPPDATSFMAHISGVIGGSGSSKGLRRVKAYSWPRQVWEVCDRSRIWRQSPKRAFPPGARDIAQRVAEEFAGLRKEVT